MNALQGHQATGYHKAPITRGVLGELSKIEEEVAEAVDAHAQGVEVLVLCELADTVGAIKHFLRKHHPTITLSDLERMADLTEKAFKDGVR